MSIYLLLYVIILAVTSERSFVDTAPLSFDAGKCTLHVKNNVIGIPFMANGFINILL